MQRGEAPHTKWDAGLLMSFPYH